MKKSLLCAIAVAVSVISANIHPSNAQDTATYHVQGVVKALPGNGRGANEVLIAHDPIPDYRDPDGAVVGMHAMTMPFYLADGVTLNGIEVGDSVEFVLESRFKPSFTEKVTSISEMKK